MAYGQSVTAALLRARADLRARRRSWVALTLVLGLAAGAVLTLLAGGRRTNSASPRFQQSQRAPDMIMSAPYGPGFAAVDLNAVSRLPQVAVAGRVSFLSMVEPDISLVVATDANAGRTVQVPKILHGRLPAADRADEIAVAFTTARRRHLHVGSRLTVHVATTYQPEAAQQPQIPPLAVNVRVVGIEASPGDFPPVAQGSSDYVYASRALLDRVQHDYGALDTLMLRLRRGTADVPAVNDALLKMSGGQPISAYSMDVQAQNVQRSFHLQAVALWAAGALLGLVLLLVAAQLLARQSFLESREHPTLAALGMTDDELWLVGMIRAVAVGVGAAVIAVAVAIAVSPLMPIGTARIAEPHPGLSVDWVVLGIGAVVVVLAVTLVAAVPTWRLSRVTPEHEPLSTSLVARMNIPGPMPAPANVGIRMALQPGRGATAVPLRSSLAGVVVALVALTAAVIFGASLTHFIATPRLYGATFDAVVTSSAPVDVTTDALPRIERDNHVDAATNAFTGVPMAVDNRAVEALVLEPAKGSIEPAVVSGRAPAAADEILLGTKTARQIHRGVGSSVVVYITAAAPNPQRMRVVGTGVLPPTSDASQLGQGVEMSYAGELRLAPPGVTPPPTNTAFVRFVPGVSARTAAASLTRDVSPEFYTAAPPKPSDVVNFGQVQSLPLVLAGLLAALAIATLAHTLVTSIRRRRRDLAILKTLGFLPNQVRRAVAWQASSFCALALLIGIPLGVAVGRWVWIVFARQLGIVPEPVAPPLGLLLIVPATVIVANLVAAWPARLAGRIRPAVALRTE
jgi:ABC-type lipoprotein release transport system permease subunit